MKKILIADDVREVVELVRVTLEGGDYEVIDASDGKETLEKAKLEKPDLILLDIIMSKMDGFEVLGRLRKDPKTANTPVIMLTSKGQKIDEERGRNLGCSEYVVKPFSPSALLSRIEGMLGQMERSRN